MSTNMAWQRNGSVHLRESGKNIVLARQARGSLALRSLAQLGRFANYCRSPDCVNSQLSSTNEQEN
jgi:hypothetical protein